MWLVLAHADDGGAWWAAQGLQARGLQPLELWTPLDLRSFVWNHHLTVDGVTTTITGAGTRSIASDELCGVLNRLPSTPQPPPSRILDADRRYAEEELFAFHLSWLAALGCPVVNRPSPRGLCGTVIEAFELRVLAARRSLPVVAMQESSRRPPGFVVEEPSYAHEVWLCREKCFGSALASEVGDACREIAKELGLDLAVFRFTDEGRLLHIDILPDLAAGGEDLLDALAAAMKRP